jgi:small subunit ribosomal protein S6
MNNYELTVLVRNEADMDPVRKLLEGYEAKVTDETKWGKRDLAYPIEKETSAYYFTLQLGIAPNHIAEFKQKMNFDEKVLRYLMLKRS